MKPIKKSALVTIAAGLGLQVVAFVANALTQALASPRLAQSLALAIGLGGAIVLVGCIQLARAKGQAWYLGLLGLLSCVGVAVLWFLIPDKSSV